MKSAGVAIGALLLALLHMILAGAYARETPYRSPGRLLINAGLAIPDVGAPDERQHANYIQNLLTGKGLPVFRPDGPDVSEHYEDHQPPLYYALAAASAKVLGVASVEDPGAFRIRWLNALIGAGTVLGVFALGLWGTGRVDVAFGAAAIAAALPMNCALSGAIGNDPLLYAICTWTLAVCARALRNGWSLGIALAAGLLAGLGILTKSTAIVLLPVLLIAALIPQKKRPTPLMAAVALAAILATGGPWLYRNYALYGDPLAQKVFKQAFVGSAQKSTMVELAREQNPDAGNAELIYWRDWVGWWTARSFFGAFGYMDIWLNETGSPYGSTPRRPAPNLAYRLLIAVSLILTLAWLASFFGSAFRDARASQVLNLALLAFVVALFVVFNATYFQGQGRYLYPAIGPLAVAFSIGSFFLLRERGRIGVAVFAGALLLLNVYAIAKLPEEFRIRTENVATTVRPQSTPSGFSL